VLNGIACPICWLQEVVIGAGLVMKYLFPGRNSTLIVTGPYRGLSISASTAAPARFEERYFPLRFTVSYIYIR